MEGIAAAMAGVAPEDVSTALTMKAAFPDDADRKSYAAAHLLGEVPASIQEFPAFYADRRERLKERIVQMLGRG